MTNAIQKPALLNVGEVAELCGMSTKQVYRAAHAGRMPKPITLEKNRLIRWRREDIERWIADGCPSLKGGVQ